MGEAKTKKTRASVTKYIGAVENTTRRADAKVVLKLMREASGETPAMWGPSIIGFGTYRYVYDSGRTGDWPIIGFSPRKANLVLYLAQTSKKRAPLLKKLGKHKTGKACLYINKLADIDVDVLKQLIADSVAHTRANHDCGACKEPAAKPKKKATKKKAAKKKAAKKKAAKKKAAKKKATKKKPTKKRTTKKKAAKKKAAKKKAKKKKAKKKKAKKKLT